MESGLEQKQTFLRNQILESGLDGEAFMVFMSIAKNQGEGINLQNWTLDELKKVVSDFKNSIQEEIDLQNKKINTEAHRTSMNRMTAQIMENLEKSNKVYYDWNDLWDYEMYHEQECKKLSKYFEFKEDPWIDYKSWDIKKTGGFIFGMIGAKNELEITFFTNFSKNGVTRSTEDIDWLRNVLSAKFPGSFIPPLEAIRSIEPEDKTGIMRHVKQSILFLNSLLSFDYLVQNPYFAEFMNQTDHKKFTTFKNRPNILKEVADIASVETTEGHFTVQISQRVLNFVKQASSYSTAAEDNYRNLENNIRKVLGDMETLAKHLHYIGNDFAKIHEKHNKIVEKCKIRGQNKQPEKLSNIFVYLNNLFTTMGNEQKKTINVLREFAQDFVRYVHAQWSEFTIHHKKYLNQQQNYLVLKHNLLKKKERNLGDVAKWELDEREQFRMSRVNVQNMNKEDAFEIMFPKDNKIEEQSKIWQAFINQMYEKSFRLLLHQQEKMYLKNCSQLCFKIQKVHQDQAEMSKKFNDLFIAH